MCRTISLSNSFLCFGFLLLPLLLRLYPILLALHQIIVLINMMLFLISTTLRGFLSLYRIYKECWSVRNKPGLFRIYRFWNSVEDSLKSYLARRSLGSYFHDREGWYVLLRLLLSIDLFLYTTLYSWIIPPDFIKWAFLIGVVSILLDILLSHTAIIFVTAQATDTLRSFVLVFLSFLTVVVSFAVLYVFFQDQFHYSVPITQKPVAAFHQDDCVSDARTTPTQIPKFSMVYFSFTTITTIGYGDIHPCPN